MHTEHHPPSPADHNNAKAIHSLSSPQDRETRRETPALDSLNDMDQNPIDRRAYRDAWLAELWPVSREVSREQREIDRYIATEKKRNSTDKVA